PAYLVSAAPRAARDIARSRDDLPRQLRRRRGVPCGRGAPSRTRLAPARSAPVRAVRLGRRRGPDRVDALRQVPRRRPALGGDRGAALLRRADHVPDHDPARLGAAARRAESIRAGAPGRPCDPARAGDGGKRRRRQSGRQPPAATHDPGRRRRDLLLPLPARSGALRRARMSRSLDGDGLPAVEALDVSKSFWIPHEQRARLKEYFAHPLKRVEYERNDALCDVSFSVEEGEFFGVIGPNGSGKSTLLKLLAGIYRADAGTVRVRGRVSPFIELGVGFNPEFSARTNIEINGMLIGMTRRQVAERFDAILEFAGLERFVDQQLKNYSSGMLLRLAYSVAIQVPFDILL